MNKKILAVLMALMMVLTSAVAFAEDEVVVPETSFTLNKIYTGDGRDGETFEFELKNAADNNGPALTFADGTNSLTFAADNIASSTDDGVAQSLTINVPAVGNNGYEAKPATYGYTLTEKRGTNDNITYDATIWNILVTVYNAAAEGQAPSYATTLSIRENGGAKNDSADFENEYTATNSLIVKKQITGNMAVSTDTFTIEVTITDADGNALVLDEPVVATPSADTITVTAKDDGVYEITGIGHDDYVTFVNLPQGAKYVVEETENKGYTEEYDEFKSRTLTENENITTIVTNEKSDDIDTGVFTDNMPYFMLMAFVMIIAAAVVLKKRTVNE